MHGFFAVSSFMILGLLCWMVYRNFTPFIRFEKKTGQLFQQHFGNPDMNYSDGIVNSGLTFLATYGSAPFISITTCFIAGFLFINGYTGLAIWFLGVVSTGGIVGIFLKRIIRRNRPKNHLSFDHGFSFPSGHAIASTLFFLAILLVFLPMIQDIAIRLSLMGLVYLVWSGILFSRLYFHAHHIGDLLAGISLGVFGVMTSMLIYSVIPQDYVTIMVRRFLEMLGVY